ncbi:hypothetical protein [Desulfonatronum lacustre]|nr:hypothetical protein [Desulfonatronum lacustre]
MVFDRRFLEFFTAFKGLKSNTVKYARSMLQKDGGFVAILSNPA